jgi:lantibiotic modifying enzyme
MALTIPFSRQQRITNALLLNASFIDNLGLMHGKTGIAIYFFHLARETKNSIYEDYAGELIDEIYEEINIHTPCDFENGLAGIGWGIEYLVQNGFIDADTDEVLEEFDKRIIHEITFHTPEDIGLLKGLAGYIAYFSKRTKVGMSKNNDTITNQDALLKAINLLEQNIIVKKYDLWTELDRFDITWNFPMVLWILTELYESGICQINSKRIIQNIIKPLKIKNNYPRLQSNCLLLTLAIEKLKHSKFEIFPHSFLDNLPQLLLDNMERESTSNELVPNSAFLQKGTGGVAWIYKQLFLLTNNDFFQRESLYWNARSKEFAETDQGYAGFHVTKEDENMAFGLLNGLAGIGLSEIVKIEQLIPKL